METGDLFDSSGFSVRGWGFLRATIKSHGLDPDLFEPYWVQLVAQEYEFKEMTLNNLDRKWEAVSAYQKSIRRGDVMVAKRVASALLNTGNCEMIRYLWRRLCTTAAEDIGLGNPTAVAFTLLCAETFTPSKHAELQKPVVYYLTDMLGTSLKDRSLCSMAVIDAYFWKSSQEQRTTIWDVLSDEDQALVHAVGTCDEYPSEDPVIQYMAKQNWRTEEMGKFYPVCKLLQEGQIEQRIPSLTEAPLIMGLPSYAYDMHTQVGKKVLAVLTGFKQVKEFFAKYPVSDRVKCLGWALFYNEGGLMDAELVYDGRQELLQAEQRVAFSAQGLPLEAIQPLMDLMSSLLVSGEVDSLRTKGAKVRYA